MYTTTAIYGEVLHKRTKTRLVIGQLLGVVFGLGQERSTNRHLRDLKKRVHAAMQQARKPYQARDRSLSLVVFNSPPNAAFNL